MAPKSTRLETPFDSIENAQDYLHLLLEAIVEARNDVTADTAEAEQAALRRRLDALRLVQFKMEKLEQHLRAGSRLLNDLRTLRRLLWKNATSRLLKKYLADVSLTSSAKAGTENKASYRSAAPPKSDSRPSFSSAASLFYARSFSANFCSSFASLGEMTNMQ